jgi:hypothetical protein
MSKINSNTEYKLDNNLFANRLNKKLFLNTNLSNSNIPNNNNSLTKIYNQTKTTEISIQTNIRPFNKIFTTSKNNNFKYSSLILSTTNNSFNNTLLNNYLSNNNNNKSYDKQKNIKLPILVKDYEILNILKKSQNNNNNNKNFINNYKTKKNNNFSNHIYINGRILGEKKPFNNIEKEYIINYVKNYAFRHKVQNLKKNVKIFGEKVDYNKNKIKKPKIPKPLLITKKPNDFMNLIQNKINY